MLRFMDFRSAGERDWLGTKWGLLAAIDLGMLAVSSMGKSREHPPCENGCQYSSAGSWALIKPHVCLHLFIISFIPLPQLFCLSLTHTALCSQLNLCIKRKKKTNNFCKIVMFMLYEIFIWNCFAKLLYFCMNVFFIGIIRNSYLTLARLLRLFCWRSSVMHHCYGSFLLPSSHMDTVRSGWAPWVDTSHFSNQTRSKTQMLSEHFVKLPAAAAGSSKWPLPVL